MTEELTIDQAVEMWTIYFSDPFFAAETVRPAIIRFLARGDTFCVYRNADLGHPDIGCPQGCSYGSEAAQLTRTQFPDGPPTTMPDIGSIIGWRYQLVGIVKP